MYLAHAHTNLDSLNHPKTPEQWRIAANTPGTHAYKMMNEIIMTNAEFAVMLEKFIHQCIQNTLQEERKKHNELRKKEIIREKREEKERQENAIREMAAAMKKQAENLPDNERYLRNYVALVDDQIDALKAKNKELTATIKELDKDMASNDLLWDRDKKIENFVAALKAIKIRDVKNKVVVLDDAALIELAKAAFVSPSKIVKNNPVLLKEHKAFEKEQQELAQKGINVKDINEIERDKMGMNGHMKVLFMLTELLHSEISPTTINKIVKNNPEISKKLQQLYQTYNPDDLKTIQKTFALGADRVEAQDAVTLNDKKINACENLLRDLAMDIRQDYKNRPGGG